MIRSMIPIYKIVLVNLLKNYLMKEDQGYPVSLNIKDSVLINRK